MTRILHKHLRLLAYKVKIFRVLQPNDLSQRAAVAAEIPNKDNRNNFERLKANSFFFFDEVTFHTLGRVNSHNFKI